jgi:hypothetical protein
MQVHLEKAQAAAKVDARATGIKRLRRVCADRIKAAEAIDQAFATLAPAVAKLAELDAVLIELQNQGVASKNAVAGYNFGAMRIQALLDVAAAKQGLMGKALPGQTPDQLLTTVDSVKRDNDTLMIGVEAE